MVLPGGVPPCFIEVDSGPGAETLYSCRACGGIRSMKAATIQRHCRNENHIERACQWSDHQDKSPTPSVSSPTPSESAHSDDQNNIHDTMVITPNVDSGNDVQDQDFEMRQRTIIDLWTRVQSGTFENINHNIDRTEDNTTNQPDQFDSSDPSDIDENEPEGSERVIADDNNNDESAWAPFSSLEQLVGLLILGSTRTTMSQRQYERVRSYVGLLGVKLPGYKSIQNLRRRLKTQYYFDVSETVGPLGRTSFALKFKQILSQELANPYVCDHLQFMPELPSIADKVDRFAQSRKWREELDRDLRVQMVALPQAHFYLFEPVQLKSKQIIIPGFYYQQGTEVFAKCAPAHQSIQKDPDGNQHIHIYFDSAPGFNSSVLLAINVKEFWKIFDAIEIRPGVMMKTYCGDSMYEDVGAGSFLEVPLQNPWREKADGKIIRHLPLVLYCDDLSGNISKRWNKHIAFYCTLAGLPPKLSNQEYNCHFLTTSNTAGALELADPLIDELNEIATNGFVAYDHRAQAEVFVMAVVLCHLGDSPMHAEVSNTMNPTVSLSPCRVCDLKVATLIKKRSPEYVSNFVGVDKQGHKLCLPTRIWSETKQGTKDLWNLAQQPGTIGAFESKSGKVGIKDVLNTVFVRRAQDFHCDPNLSAVEVEVMCQDLNNTFGERLFNPFLRLKGFDGHQDTPVEILHVLLLGVAKYLLRDQMQRCSAKEKNDIWGRWRSFNTSGLNVPPIQPKSMINHFLSLTGKEF